MKKYILSLAFFTTSIVLSTQAQSNALGIRLGGSDGVQAEISYQKQTSTNNRLEFDLGFINAGWYNGFKFSLQYHWVMPLANNFYWYVGPGGSIGAWNFNDGKPGNDEFHEEGLFLDAVGQIGIEYRCNIPLQFSLDARPEFGLVNDDFDFGYGLGIRYTF